MYSCQGNMKYLFVLFFSFFASGVQGVAQVITPDRRVDWSNAGLRRTKPAYNNLRVITNFGGSPDGVTANDAALQSAIQSLGSDSGIIYFPPGNYLFRDQFALRSGLILRGADASSSTITFNINNPYHAINITGTATNDTSFVTTTAFKYSDAVSVANPTLFQVGDYVKLYQNDTALINDSYAMFSVAQILRVKEISGNQVKFSSTLRRTYPLSDQPRLRKLSMTSGVGIECLKIKRLDSVNQKANIYIEYAAQCWITGVEGDTTNFAHVQVGSSTNLEISGCYFHGAFGFGPNGQGYGVSMEYSSGECLIENNVFSRLRHAMMFQLGVNGNVAAYNFSRNVIRTEAPSNLSGDLVLHGNYPYANLFEGNICENIVIDASHRTNGPLNTFFRNRATGYGILMSNSCGDSTNMVGNEITGTAFGQGNYIMTGIGNFEYGNNRRGTVLPPGTNTLSDVSYYYASTPTFWEPGLNFPSIGLPNAIGAGTNPAKARVDAGINYTTCAPRLTYTFTGNGNWFTPSNWQNQLVPPVTITSGMDVVIDPIASGECLYTGTINVQKGGKVTVKQGKTLTIKMN